jgi:tetratricopeptide (TPR) repeat protein
MMRHISFGLRLAALVTIATLGRIGDLPAAPPSTDPEQLYQQSLELYERSYGPVHPEIARTLQEMGELYIRQGRDDKAVAAYERARDVLVQTVGPDHPDLVPVLLRLAALYRDPSREDAAMRLLNDGLRISQLGGKSELAVANQARVLVARGLLYQGAGRNREAEADFQASLALSDTLTAFGRQYRQMCRLSAAEPLFQQAATIRETILGGQTDPAADTENKDLRHCAPKARR